MVQPDQAIGPRVSSRSERMQHGIESAEDLFPFLDRAELEANMSIPLLEQ